MAELCGAALNGAAQGFPGLYCDRDTGFSLFMISRLPTAGEMAAMCTNSNCQTVLAAIRANVPKECQVSYYDKIMLYSQVLDPIQATCGNLPKTPPPTTAAPVTAKPVTAAPPPPPATTTPVPAPVTPATPVPTTATATPVSTTATPGSTAATPVGNSGSAADSTSSSTDSMSSGSGSSSAGNGTSSVRMTSRPSTSTNGTTTLITNSKSSDSGINVSMIAGIAAGVVVVVALIAFLAFRAGKKKNAVPKTPDVEYAVYGAARNEHGTNGTYATDRSSSAARTNTRTSTARGIAFHTKSRGSDAAAGPGAIGLWGHPSIQSARIPLEGIIFGEVLSRGAFGEVLLGTYDGETVAIKRLLTERRKNMQEIESFLEEVKLVSTLHHPRIVRFIGVAWDSLSDLCLVAEFMDGGDLRSLLSQYDSTHHPTGFNADKAKIAMHVAHALSYLHGLSPNVVHRDLKSKNVLLSKNLDAKLTDFGVSRQRAESTMTAGVGSSLWMAPEVMVGDRYSEKADIFSFGVLLSELDTQLLPYAHAFEPGTDRKLPEMAILQMVSMGRISVDFSEGADTEIVELARLCVALEPAERPTANEVLRRFHHVWRQYGGFA